MVRCFVPNMCHFFLPILGIWPLEAAMTKERVQMEVTRQCPSGTVPPIASPAPGAARMRIRTQYTTSHPGNYPLKA